METMELGTGLLGWRLKVHLDELFQVVVLEQDKATIVRFCKIHHPSVQTVVNLNLLREMNQLPPTTSKGRAISRVNLSSNRATFQSKWALDLRTSPVEMGILTVPHKVMAQESQVHKSLKRLFPVRRAKVELTVDSRASRGLFIKAIRLIKTTIMTRAVTTVWARSNRTVRLGVEPILSNVKPTKAARRG